MEKKKRGKSENQSHRMREVLKDKKGKKIKQEKRERESEREREGEGEYKQGRQLSHKKFPSLSLSDYITNWRTNFRSFKIVDLEELNH